MVRRLRFSGPKTSIICSPMTSLKTSIKTITYLSDIGCLEIQGASLALPYSTMYLRLNEGQRIFVVLGYIEQEQSKWLSQDNAMLVTHNGRLLKTVKLNNNLLEVTNSGQDPLRNALAIKDGSRWTRDILWSEDNHFRSATLSSTFSFAGLETLNIAGRNVLCNVWQEEVTSTRPEKQWQNTFWVDSATGQVRQSRQMLGAGVIPVEMTFLKPAP
ncbi:regulator [Escherichia coli]|nr:regulator [Escherichia coli]OOJ51571.1 regulator [Escherichia coli]